MVEGITPGSPAESAGNVIKGDTIVEVDNVCIRRMPLEAVMQRLRGEPNTAVVIVLLRHGHNARQRQLQSERQRASDEAKSEPGAGAVGGGGAVAPASSAQEAPLDMAAATAQEPERASTGNDSGKSGDGSGAVLVAEADASQWTEHRLASGTAYYVHETTCEVSWARPDATSSETGSGDASHGNGSGEADDEWTDHVDPSTGRT